MNIATHTHTGHMRTADDDDGAADDEYRPKQRRNNKTDRPRMTRTYIHANESS